MMPRFYFDFEKHFSYFERGQTPWTPAVSVMFSLDLAIQKLLADGMEAVYTKHAKIAADVRRGVKGTGSGALCRRRGLRIQHGDCR